MELLIVTAGLSAIAGIGAAWHWRRTQIAQLRCELKVERHAASHDPLTGLLNRRAFYQLGAALVSDPGRHPLVAVVLDLDNFKRINDVFGHHAGDEVLVTVARRLESYAGDNLIARIGGDEFAGLISVQASNRQGQRATMRKLAATVAAPIPIAGRSVSVTASVGLVPFSEDAHLADVLRHADADMYRAKTHRDRVMAVVGASRPSLLEACGMEAGSWLSAPVSPE